MKAFLRADNLSLRKSIAHGFGTAAWGMAALDIDSPQKLEEEKRKALETELLNHEKKHPPLVIKTLDGTVIPEGTPVADLTLPGGLRELEIHPDAEVPVEAQ